MVYDLPYTVYGLTVRESLAIVITKASTVPGIATEIKFIVRSKPKRIHGADERLFPSFTASGEGHVIFLGLGQVYFWIKL